MNDGAIIRPAKGEPYTILPNTLLRDRRLSADTRTMVALLLSKPKGWRIRPPALAKELAHKSVERLGREKMARMFREATSAGYMARVQARNDGGLFSGFAYFVGMPEDVKGAIDRADGAEREAGYPSTVEPATVEPSTVEPEPDNQHAYKEKILKTNQSKKPPLKVPPAALAAAPQGATDGELAGCDAAQADATARATASQQERGSDWRARNDRKHAALAELHAGVARDQASEQGAELALTAFGRAAQDQGCRFVWEGSKAAVAWSLFRGRDGMPPIDEALVAGERRHGFWFVSLYPPTRTAARAGGERC